MASSLHEVTPADLHRRVTADSQLVVIDLLPPPHFKIVHLPQARNACVFEVAFLENVARLAPDKDQSLVVYGASAHSADAATAVDKLVRAGYAQVETLRGGLDAWRRAGLPLAGEDPEAQPDPQTQVILADGAYNVDLSDSRIEWMGRNPNTRHTGSVDLSAGEITIDSGVITGCFVIDMAAIRNFSLAGDALQPVLLAHLASDDFFFVERFPKANFTLTRGRPAAAATLTSPNYELAGTLELRGVTAEQTFLATITPGEDGALLAEAHFDLDRTRWKVIYGSARFFEQLGMHLVFDMISVELRIKAYPKA
jgi:rhodanese-related sulfurtransferase